MFNGRMLSIIRYLKQHPESSYREMAVNLKVSERSVRYDVDRINDILSLEKLPEIEKHSKGVLCYPKGLNLKGLEEDSEVIYSGKERMSVLLLILLLRNQELKINRLSEQFKVSRSTIKNDMAALDEMLKQEGLSIGYTDHFYLEGSRNKRIILLNQEFRKYINYLMNPFTNYNSYEFYCIHIIHMAFEGISIPNVVLCVDKLLESLQCTLTNTSYAWYMSNIMVLIWFIIHEKEYPLDLSLVPEFDREKFGEFSKQLEQIIKRPISENHVCLMAKLFDFTNKFAGLNETVDPVHAETVTFSLIAAMSQQMGFPFDKDKLLVEGLLNHMIPLIQRIRDHIEIKENLNSLLGPEELKLHGLMDQVCKNLDTLKEISNEGEIVYLTVCFMASIRRMKNTPYKRVLLVCGHGYGTTTMLKESLLSEYQIHIMDTIPLYRISAYPDWEGIDYVFSTTPVNYSLPRPCIVVNPILRAEDRIAIEHLLIPRKTILSSYYAIEERLTFLDSETRARVMDVIERELGYQTVKAVHSPKSFSSFLKFDCILLTDQKFTWKQAAEQSGKLLSRRGFIENSYIEGMIDFIEEQGFYAVSDDSFALLHGKGNEGIVKTSLSLIVNRQPVYFGDKKVRVIFCLASKDGKEQIPAVVTLMRMVKTTPLIHDLEQCKSEEEIYQTILNCEFEVLF
ncbi:MAG: PTS sugar transporter subunit IIA [Hungatella sp.]